LRLPSSYLPLIFAAWLQGATAIARAIDTVILESIL